MLKLNNSPFSLTTEQVRKYEGTWIFRAGMQYIKPNHTGDRDLPDFSIANVHILPSYAMYKMEKNVRMSQGELIYFTSEQYDDKTKKYSYDPFRIEIGYTGSIIVEGNPELAFFLDNHPANEVVLADPNHVNHDAKMQTNFATYSKRKNVEKMEKLLELQLELLTRVSKPTSTTDEEIKAIAKLTFATAADYKMPHKLQDIDKSTPKELRVEIMRLCNMHPEAMKKILDSLQIDYYEWIAKFKELQILKLDGKDWKIVEPGTQPVTILTTQPTDDTEKALVDWFQRFDRQNAKFSKLKSIFNKYSESRQKTVEDK